MGSTSGRDELLATDFSQLSLNSVYAVADTLLRNQDKIESYPAQKERSMFSLSETIILYDVTNTYFEGIAACNKKAQFVKKRNGRIVGW